MSRNKIISIVASIAIASSLLIGASINATNTHTQNITLLSTTTTSSQTKAVVVNAPDSQLALYNSSNPNAKISSYISVGEMLTINQTVGNYYYVTVQETGAKGYINKNNAQIITSGLNAPVTSVNKSGSIINVSSFVYLRSKPTINSKVVANLLNSTNINIVSKQGDWYKVETNNGTGYVYSEYVGVSTKAISNQNSIITSNVKGNNTQTYLTNTSDVVIKTAPDWNSKSLQTIKHEAVPVTVISSDNNWDKVKLSNGVAGYVPSGSVITGIINMNNAIASAAKSTANATKNAINTATSVGSGLASIVNSAANVVNTFNNNVNTTVTQAANNAKNISNNAQSNINSTAKNIQNIGNNVANTANSIGNTINNASNTANNVSNTIQSTAANANKTISNINNTINSTAKNIADTANNVNSNIKSTVDNAHQNIKDINNTIKTTNENINNTAKNISNGVNSNVTSTANNINTINNGINSAANKVINGINNLNHNISNIL
ncbi:MAG: SH3 domain-containing protein [Sarcina sp.]